MKFTMKELKSFCKEQEYLDLQRELFAELKIKALRGGCDVLYKLDLQGLKSCEIPLSEVRNILHTEREQIKKYVIRKIRALEENPGEQEYPDNELPDEDDVRYEIDTAVDEGASQNFLFGHLLEYAIMAEKPDRMADYLKINDIPFAGKYRKALKSYFSESRNA